MHLRIRKHRLRPPVGDDPALVKGQHPSSIALHHLHVVLDEGRGVPTLFEQQQFWDVKWEKEKDVYPNPWALRRGTVILDTLSSLPVAH